MKSGKRREIRVRISYDHARELGFCGSFDEWTD